MVDTNEIIILDDGTILTQVPDFSSYYADIENGILYSVRTGEELKRMKTHERTGKHNYVMTTLKDDTGISKSVGVHEAVCAAREGSWEWKYLHGLEVDHVNEKKNDNRGYINLELKTHKEQYTDSVRQKISESKRGSNNHNAKLDENDVLEIRQRFEVWEGRRQKFIQDIAEEFSVSVSAIYGVVDRYTWNHI